MIQKTKIKDLLVIKKKKFLDNRGKLIKPYSKSFIKNFNIKECYFTFSKKNVIRGIHCQKKNGCRKIVFVAKGKILDVVIDLRKNSKTYKNIFSSVLHEKDSHSLLIPAGFGHGYKVMSDFAIVFYLWDKTLEQSKDYSVYWKSINFNWKIKNPIMSKKDKLAKKI
jgi:dTDP-4-dehydrorhamnose 3,5-epimerase